MLSLFADDQVVSVVDVTAVDISYGGNLANLVVATPVAAEAIVVVAKTCSLLNMHVHVYNVDM